MALGILTPQAQVKLAKHVAGFETGFSRGKTHWQKENAEIFIATMDKVQPHAHTAGYATYCVEALGPHWSGDEGNPVWEYFDDYEAALKQVIQYMKDTMDEEEFEKQIAEQLKST